MGNIEHVFYLNDVNNFQGLSNNDTVIFQIVRSGVQDAYEERIIRFNKDNIMLSDADDGNDFEAIFMDGNVQESTNVLIIPKDQIPEGVDETFTITVDVWGNVRSRTFYTSDYEWDDVWQWSTLELEIEDIMQDIFPSAECDIAVQFYRDGEEAEQAHGQVKIYNSPFVDSQMTLDADWPVITIAYFPEDMEEFTVVVYNENSVLLNNFTFKVSEMDQYLSLDDCYELYLSDIEIDELGDYGVEVEFPRFSWYNRVSVVPFVINIYHNWDEMTEPLCRIALPEGSEGNVTIELNGNKVYEKALEDIYYDEYFRGPGYYVDVNSLNITESDRYVVYITVTTEEYSRTVSSLEYVEVSDNTFSFMDSIYGDFNFDVHIGTAISQDSVIILYLNGEPAATGGTDHGFYFDFDESYTDIYGSLLPGEYQARLEIDDEVVAEDMFAVLDDSGDANVDVVEDEGAVSVTFKAPMPLDATLDGYGLDIYVDATNPYYWNPEDEPVASYRYEDLRDLLDYKTHAIELGELDPGEHIIYVVYRTDMDYPLEEQDFFVRIYNITVEAPELVNTALTASKVTADYNSTKKLTATLKDIDGNVISGAKVKFVVGDITKTVKTNANGKASLAIGTLLPGTYTATITYAGDETYAASKTTAKVVINKLNTVLSANDIVVVHNESSKLYIYLKDANGNAITGIKINVVLGDITKSIKSDANGRITVSTKTLDVGNYTAFISCDGNEIYAPSSTTASVVVTKMPTVLTAKDVVTDYDASSRLYVYLKDANSNPITGVKVKVVLGDIVKNIKTDAKGSISVSTKTLDPGNYTAFISCDGNDLYDSSSTTANVLVRGFPTVLSADDLVAEYNVASKFYVYLKDAEGNPITGAKVNLVLGIINKTVKTDAKGRISASTKNLESGTYTAVATYAGSDLYAPSSTTATVSVKYSTVLTANDVNAIYNVGSRLYATLKDADGNPIAGAKVNLVLGNINKTVKTDANGKISASTKNLDIGSYVAVITFAGDDIYSPSSTTANVFVSNEYSFLSANDVVATYNVSSKVYATLKDADGNPIVGAKVNMVLGNINKTVKTDSKGRVSASTKNLAPGDYTASVSFAGDGYYAPSSTTASVVVTDKIPTTLTAKDIVATYNVSSRLYVTLKDVDGNIISGVKVNVVLGNIKKTLKTDAKGRVSVSTLPLERGSYTAVITCEGNDIYAGSDTTASVVVR
ncbi:Ig-like domain repeat protein [Methanobrevibacter sp.]|uniref:Ig-like domain repeat protein n=1 Tax=Methanobrevibacter sp. TaxID=66852 RepID=UPI00389102BD